MDTSEIEKRLKEDKLLTKDEVMTLLESLSEEGDYEDAHWCADRILVKYINDKEIEDAYDEIGKWYA